MAAVRVLCWLRSRSPGLTLLSFSRRIAFGRHAHTPQTPGRYSGSRRRCDHCSADIRQDAGQAAAAVEAVARTAGADRRAQNSLSGVCRDDPRETGARNGGPAKASRIEEKALLAVCAFARDRKATAAPRRAICSRSRRAANSTFRSTSRPCSARHFYNLAPFAPVNAPAKLARPPLSPRLRMCPKADREIDDFMTVPRSRPG